MNTRSIPNGIKREVRQRCGFGCVICGLPLYEYDHMVEWAQNHTHNADEITLLCDKHHKEVTNGLLTRDMVSEFNKNPFNKKNQISSPWGLHFRGDSFQVDIGSNEFLFDFSNGGNVFFPIIVDNMPIVMIKFIDGELLLNICLFDENKNLILHIVDNELQYSISPWDIELIGSTLTIREGKRKFLFQIKFCPPNKIAIERVKLRFNGIDINIENNILIVGEKTVSISNSKVVNMIGGLLLGNTNFPNGAFKLQGLKRRYKESF